MRRRRVPFRPGLRRRAVVWFPPAAGLEAFRAAHDPQAARIAAHLTLVFPFASTLGSLQVAAHVRRVVARWPRIPVRLEPVDTIGGRFVVVRATRGRDAIVALHDRLYRGALAPFLRRDIPYDPHVTVALAPTADACAGLVAAARAALGAPIDATLDALAVCEVPAAGPILREHVVPLG